MGRILERMAAGPALWLDDTVYAERLLANGRAPWQDVAEYVAFRRKSQGLLRSDVIALPVACFAAERVASDANLRDALQGKRRAIAPARSLLADEALRRHLIEVLEALRAAFAHEPLALVLPSPRAWVAHAYRLAFGADAEIEVGGDEADACAVYVAEFLGHFGESGIDGVLLEEDLGHEPEDAEQIAWYKPVLNLAAHYRWDLGLRLPSAEGYRGAVEGLSFLIAPIELPGTRCGHALGPAFWNGQAAPTTGLRYAQVPVGAVPEQVLARLASLRS